MTQSIRFSNGSGSFLGLSYQERCKELGGSGALNVGTKFRLKTAVMKWAWKEEPFWFILELIKFCSVWSDCYWMIHSLHFINPIADRNSWQDYGVFICSDVVTWPWLLLHPASLFTDFKFPSLQECWGTSTAVETSQPFPDKPQQRSEACFLIPTNLEPSKPL